MATHLVHNGRDSRDFLGGTEQGGNDIYSRLLGLEALTRGVGRGGVRGGGDPNYGFPPPVPLVANAVATARWDSATARWILGLEVDVAYDAPPDFLLLEMEVVGDNGFDVPIPASPPAPTTWTVEDIGLAFGVTYAVRLRAAVGTRGFGAWCDFFGGIYMTPDPTHPPAPAWATDPLPDAGVDSRGAWQDLAWEEVTGVLIRGYRARWRFVGAVDWAALDILDPTTTTARLPALYQEGNYEAEIGSLPINGSEAVYNPVLQPFTAAQAPAPTGLAHAAHGPDTDGLYWIDLTWDLPDVIPTAYRIRYVPHGGSYHQTRWWVVPAINRAGDPVSHTRIRSIHPGTMDYAIRSIFALTGEGAESDPALQYLISPAILPRPKPPLPPPADSTDDNPLDGWTQVDGNTPIAVTDAVRSNGASFVLAPDSGDDVVMVSLPIYAKGGQQIVVKVAHQSPDGLDALMRLYEYDSADSFITLQTIVNDSEDGDPHYSEWTSAPLDGDTETVKLYIKSSAAGGPSVHYWAFEWDVRKEDVDLGVITTASKIAPATDDSDRQQGLNKATGEPAWETFYSTGGGTVVFAALNQTSGPKGLHLKDAYGNSLLQNATGVTLTSISQIRLTGMLTLTPTHTSTDRTLTPADSSVVADITGATVVLTLPPVADSLDGLYLIRAYYDPVLGVGGTVCTVAADGSETIDGNPSIDLAANELLWVVADTTGWTSLRGGGGTPTFSAQSANVVFAGPATGSPAVPTFRALTPDDLPFVPTTGTDIREWTLSESYQMLTVTYDGTYPTVIAAATVLWPDASTGDFTTDTINTTWWAIDAYHITHDDSGLTATQSAVTRDSNGNVSVTPALTIA